MIAASFVVICHHICVLVSFYLITNEWEVQSMITLKNGRLKKGTHVLPLTRGQIAAQEQKKILRELATAASKGEAQTPQTRGQVAAQEQMRIIGQYIDNMSAGYKEVSIPI